MLDILKQISDKLDSNAEDLDGLERLAIAGSRELRYSNMIIESLAVALDEIETITTDPLTRGIARNAIERYNLDKLIHTRSLFPNPEGFERTEVQDVPLQGMQGEQEDEGRPDKAVPQSKKKKTKADSK